MLALALKRSHLDSTRTQLFTSGVFFSCVTHSSFFAIQNRIKKHSFCIKSMKKIIQLALFHIKYVLSQSPSSCMGSLFVIKLTSSVSISTYQINLMLVLWTQLFRPQLWTQFLHPKCQGTTVQLPQARRLLPYFLSPILSIQLTTNKISVPMECQLPNMMTVPNPITLSLTPKKLQQT